MLDHELELKRLTEFNPGNCHGGQGLVKPSANYNGPMIYFIFFKVCGHVFLGYVGKTIRGYKRIEEHREKNMPIDTWFFIPVAEDMLDEVENFYIRTYRPFLNMVDNPDLIGKDGRYIKSKVELHDVQRRRIARIHYVQEAERNRTPGYTDLFRIQVDPEREVSFLDIYPD